MRPSIIAQYALELAQSINEFYRDVPVLESKKDLLDGRLRFAAAARSVLGQALELLGIPLPDQM
jgi:arginyl-tRNA synthetase